MTDIEKLKELAGKATESPWFLHDFSDPSMNSDPTAQDVAVSCDHPATITIASMGGGFAGYKGLEQARHDAAYIAAANPSAVLDLIAEVERLREALKPFAEFADEIEDCAANTPTPIESWSTAVGFENLRAARAAYRRE